MSGDQVMWNSKKYCTDTTVLVWTIGNKALERAPSPTPFTGAFLDKSFMQALFHSSTYDPVAWLLTRSPVEFFTKTPMHLPWVTPLCFFARGPASLRTLGGCPFLRSCHMLGHCKASGQRLAVLLEPTHFCCPPRLGGHFPCSLLVLLFLFISERTPYNNCSKCF